MFNLGPAEILFILVVALLVLGPQRLPELARGLGRFFFEFRRQTDEVRGLVEREFYRLDHPAPRPPGQPAVAPGAVARGEEPVLVSAEVRVTSPESETTAVPAKESSG